MTGRDWPDPGEWVGDAPYPWPAAEWLQAGESHVACYTVVSLGHARDAHGQPVLQVELADARGALAAWLPADSGVDWIRPGLYVGVRGVIDDAGGWNVLRITEISPVRVALEDLSLFLPHTSADTSALETELGRLIGSMRQRGLRSLLERLLGSDTEIGRGFRLAPAATRNHHACLGGLFEHTVSVARLCDFAAGHYGDAVDRELLVAGALLHDIGKVREIGARAGFPYTDEGRLLGHILLGLQMVGSVAREIGLEPETRLLLEHLIASHQGRYEWQSPREPRVLEAFILHYIDDLDAKVDHARTVIDTVEAGWTDYDRSLRRELLRHTRHDAAESAVRVDPPASAVADAHESAAPEPGEAVSTPADAAAHAETLEGTNRSRQRAGAKKKPSSQRKQAKKKKTGPPASKTKRARKPLKRAADKPQEPAARDPARPAILEPGMPGFVDTDTLDLFDQE